MTKLDLLSEQLSKLKQLTEPGKEGILSFLGFSLDLQTSEFHDILQENASRAKVEMKDPTMHQQITELLFKYAQASWIGRSGKLVKFKDFPGGYAYENAFCRRAIDPIVKTFGRTPNRLIEAGKLLGGKPLNYGQSSIEVNGLEGIPITYILWTDEELPPSVNILFDDTASNYLNVEDLSGLTELTTWRLTIANSILK